MPSLKHINNAEIRNEFYSPLSKQHFNDILVIFFANQLVIPIVRKVRLGKFSVALNRDPLHEGLNDQYLL